MSSSGRPPPTKKARRSPRSGSSLASNQLTLTAMLRKNSDMTDKSNEKSKGNCSSDVIVVDDLPPKPGATSRSRDCSPELFSDGDCDDALLGCGAGGTREGENNPLDDEALIKIGMNMEETSASLDKDPDSSLTPDSSVTGAPVRHKSPSVSTRSSTRSPEIDLPPWDGAPLSEIHFGPSTYPVLPPLQSSATHAVLFRPRLKQGEPPTPFPDTFKDVWDSNHVRMPCSSQSVFPVAMTTGGGGKGGGKTLVSRWDVIKESLRKPITNSYDLEEAILTYNSRKWNFFGLHSYFSDHCSEDEASSFFGTVLPRIIDLALSLPKLVTHALPLLKKQLDYSVSLSQQQLACLLANAFLCTFPRRNARGASTEYSNYPSINFNTLFYGDSRRGVSSVAANKLTCLFHYFTR